jgi:hypothetical protein
MKLLRLSSWGTCAAALALLAANAGWPNVGRSLARPPEGHSNPATEPAGSAEWKTVGEWLREYKCDQRYDFVNHLHDGPVKENARKLIVNRFHQIEQIRDPERKKAVIAQLQAQDQIFTIQIGARGKSSPEAEAQMRSAVEKLINAQIAERTVQINRITAQLNRVKAEMDDLKARTKADRLDAIAQNYLNEAGARPRRLRSPDETKSDPEGGATNADVKR